MRLAWIFILVCVSALSRNGLAWEIHPDEQLALEKANQEKFREARALAEKRIGNQPAIVARYVLSLIQSESEGNLPRALYLVRQAKADLLALENINALSEQGMTWHRKLILHELSILAHLDRRQEELDLLDAHDKIHSPKLVARRIWPMVKLKQFEAARALGLSLLTHAEYSVRQRAFNGLMAVEEEAGNRRASFEWGTKAMEAGGTTSCVIQTNTALGARRVFDFAEAIRIDLGALEAKVDDCPTSPYAQLAPVYLLSGDFQKSVGALKELRRQPRSRRMALQNEMLIRSRFVELLFALGAFDKAWTRIEQIINKPDRSGMVSYDLDLIELGNLLLGYEVGAAQLQSLLDQISIRPYTHRWTLLLDAGKLRLKLISIARRIRRLAATEKNLIRIVRPYMYENMMWFSLSLADLLGPSVTEQALEDALSKESDLSTNAAHLLDAYKVASAHAQNELEWIVDQGPAILQRLPKGTVLLRGQLQAMLGDAQWRLGQIKDAQASFSAVMNTFPTAMRIAGVGLPVELVFKGSVETQIKEAIESSARFRFVAAAPIKLTVETNAQTTQLCLQGNKRFGCELILSTMNDEDRFKAIDQFQQKVFAPPIELSQSDLSSLDGRAIQGDAQSVIDDLLNDGRSKK